MRLEDDEEHAYRSRDSVKLEAVVHSRGYETALVGISRGDPRDSPPHRAPFYPVRRSRHLTRDGAR